MAAPPARPKPSTPPPAPKPSAYEVRSHPKGGFGVYGPDGSLLTRVVERSTAEVFASALDSTEGTP